MEEAPRPENPRALPTVLGLQEFGVPECVMRDFRGGHGLWFGETRVSPPQVVITSRRSCRAGWGPVVESVAFPVWGEIEGEIF